MRERTRAPGRRKPARRQNHRGHHYSQGQKAATVICSLIATSLLGVSLFEAGGCSKASRPIRQHQRPRQTAPGPALPAPAASMQPRRRSPRRGKTPARKTRVQRTLIASSYTNPLYGVSFRYPKNYSLKEGDKANAEWSRLEPIAMNFVQPGGTTLTMVELPNRLYPGTDLASAFFTVSVNTGLNRATCGQFASSPRPRCRWRFGGGRESGAARHGVAARDLLHRNLECRPIDGPSTEVDSSGDGGAKHGDAKYYHVFENGTCYEFALGFETTAGDPAGAPEQSCRSQPGVPQVELDAIRR